MLIKKQRAYIETWLNDHGTACENGLDADIGLRVKRWLYEDLLTEASWHDEKPPKTERMILLDELRASVHDDISQMAWEELGEAIEALKRL